MQGGRMSTRSEGSGCPGCSTMDSGFPGEKRLAVPGGTVGAEFHDGNGLQHAAAAVIS